MHVIITELLRNRGVLIEKKTPFHFAGGLHYRHLSGICIKPHFRTGKRLHDYAGKAGFIRVANYP
jgi:hypothetical protein